MALIAGGYVLGGVDNVASVSSAYNKWHENIDDLKAMGVSTSP